MKGDRKPRKARPAAKRRRGSPTGPPIRGRRGHRSVDQQAGFREYLKDLLLRRPKLTIDDMLEEIKGSGYYISRSALARFGLEFEIERARLEVVSDMARQYAPAGGSILDVETAIGALASTKILEQLMGYAGKDLDEKAAGLLLLFHRLQTSASSRERAKLAHNRGVKAAVAQIREEMLKILRKDPDTLSKVLRAIESIGKEARQ